MLYQLSDLINRVRDHFGENRDHGNTSIYKILDHINEASNKVASKMMGIRKDSLLTYLDVSLTGELYYSLPRGIESVSFIEDISSGVNTPYDTVPIEFENRYQYVLNKVATYDSRRYTIQRNKLIMPSKDNSGTLRIWYSFIPKRLLYFTATTSNDNTVVSPASVTVGNLITIDDYYNGMFLITDSGQYREITDFVGSTRTFLVDSNWDSNPSATTVISVIPPLWPRFQDLIHLEAGRTMRISLDMDINEISYTIKERYDEMEECLQQYSKQETQHVRKVGR
jgi:hypothetical protein